MIVRHGNVTITAEGVKITGFTFTGVKPPEAGFEAIEWAAGKLHDQCYKQTVEAPATDNTFESDSTP